MCRATTCRVCGKTTWAGCGQHVQEVRRTVAASQWCGGEHSEREMAEARGTRGGFFARLFGR
ncbi:hypothetical protein [Agrococcus carbonis]|uniref:Uncharacterized protein n=1 Tax=Agrococcus carbonis TaxID=684552 RepID=A0A1H1NC64_9MICO|nr:hypothetical protein [Agrococcus carbonis]SDR96335.1 hypothetical protein SAMN04489719_1226 [Agrococcus carbonis]